MILVVIVGLLLTVSLVEALILIKSWIKVASLILVVTLVQMRPLVEALIALLVTMLDNIDVPDLPSCIRVFLPN